MEALGHILTGLGYALVWLLCAAGILVSSLSFSGTWCVVAASALAWVLGRPGFPPLWVVALFAGVAGAIELVEVAAGAWGVKRRGGSAFAGLGALAGGLLGLAFGGLIPIPVFGSLLGMLAGSFLMAFGVEYLHRRKAGAAADVAAGVLVARLLMTLLKVGASLGMTATLALGMLA